YAGRADCYVLLPNYAGASLRDTFDKAREAAMQALQRDPTLGQAHIALGDVKVSLDWDFPGAESEYRQGLQLNPTYPTGRQWYGWFLSRMGRHDAGIAELKQAKQLDPESLIIRCDLAGAFGNARMYDEAVAELRAVLAKDGDYAPARSALGWVLAMEHKY